MLLRYCSYGANKSLIINYWEFKKQLETEIILMCLTCKNHLFFQIIFTLFIPNYAIELKEFEAKPQNQYPPFIFAKGENKGIKYH